MDDYDAGYDKGFLSGKKFTEGKVVRLIDDLIQDYERMETKPEFPTPAIDAYKAMERKKEYHINTAKFIKTLIFNDGQIKNE